MIRGGKDSNLPSIGMSLIEIIKINMLREISRRKIPWEKGEDHQSNARDARKITCTRISHRKDRVRTVHNIQEATTVEDMGRIYAALDD